MTYYDGCIFSKNIVVACSKLDSLDYDDYSHSNFVTYNKGNWGHEGIPFLVNSVCKFQPASRNPEYILYSLGLLSGAVQSYWPKGTNTTIEFLPGAKEQGGLLHLHQIRPIGDDLYVVGIQGQVYRRHQDKWVVFNQGLERLTSAQMQARNMTTAQIIEYTMNQDADLNSIDGTGPQNLYAVGSAGVVFYRGAGSWVSLPAVTNANLHRVRQVDAQTVYAVGDRGILLKGNAQSGFTVITTQIKDDLWGLEWFQGKLYLGSKRTGVYVYDGKSVTRVATLPEFECHTLHANAGQLLALGSKDVYLTDDAKQWQFLQNPDNV